MLLKLRQALNFWCHYAKIPWTFQRTVIQVVRKNTRLVPYSLALYLGFRKDCDKHFLASQRSFINYFTKVDAH